jgi:uncharacterized coiled-coil DUF342 family protein
MTNDEIRAIFREEMGTLKTELREEMGTLRIELREEMGTLKTELREEMGTLKTELREEMGTLRIELREEIHASETRMIRRVDGVQKNVIEIKGDLVVLGGKIDQCTQVLDEATVKIADMQESLFNLENKVDAYQAMHKQEILRIDAAISAVIQQVFELNRLLNAHIATPINKAHPGPDSAA